uniref:Uncharacterized protein n=1 Tax=Solanum lycopersicum TaxID=4081 RepID=A0A3Q7H5V5_SOLLC
MMRNLASCWGRSPLLMVEFCPIFTLICCPRRMARGKWSLHLSLKSFKFYVKIISVNGLFFI